MQKEIQEEKRFEISSEEKINLDFIKPGLGKKTTWIGFVKNFDECTIDVLKELYSEGVTTLSLPQLCERLEKKDHPGHKVVRRTNMLSKKGLIIKRNVRKHQILLSKHNSSIIRLLVTALFGERELSTHAISFKGRPKRNELPVYTRAVLDDISDWASPIDVQQVICKEYGYVALPTIQDILEKMWQKNEITRMPYHKEKSKQKRFFYKLIRS